MICPAAELKQEYNKLFSLINCHRREVVVACIGTDLIGGDCLGPVVGQLLTEANAPAFVYGTLQSPITALNADSYNAFIRFKHPNSVIIAVDSCVGVEKGKVCVSGGSIKPGAALGKKLKAFGDISVTAVTSQYAPSHKGFADVRLGFVYSLAKKIAKLIGNCIAYNIYYTKIGAEAIKFEA